MARVVDYSISHRANRRGRSPLIIGFNGWE
jgi:hypothetical protein